MGYNAASRPFLAEGWRKPEFVANKFSAATGRARCATWNDTGMKSGTVPRASGRKKCADRRSQRNPEMNRKKTQSTLNLTPQTKKRRPCVQGRRFFWGGNDGAAVDCLQRLCSPSRGERRPPNRHDQNFPGKRPLASGDTIIGFNCVEACIALGIPPKRTADLLKWQVRRENLPRGWDKMRLQVHLTKLRLMRGRASSCWHAPRRPGKIRAT